MSPEFLNRNLTEDQLTAFNRDGVLELGTLFDPEEIEGIRNAFNAVVTVSHPRMKVGYEADGRTIRSVMGWHHASEHLRKFTFDPRILAAVQTILGEEVAIHQTK